MLAHYEIIKDLKVFQKWEHFCFIKIYPISTNLSLVYTGRMKSNDDPWRTLSSKVTYTNPWMTVYEDTVQMPNGRESIYGFIDGKPGVFIIALDKDSKVHLIESYRYPTQKWQWELPTGGIDKGFSPLQAAQHELAEELGLSAAKWTHINTFGPSSNGFMKDTQDVFVAEELSISDEKPEDFEAIRATKKVTFSELTATISEGVLINGQSLAALMQFAVWRQLV